MLRIFANNSELDLGTLRGISLNFNPGIFELESFEGSYSVPFTIPANEINNLVFGFMHKVTSKSKAIVELDAEIWHSGIKLFEGLIRAEKFSEKEISCTFYTQNGEIFSQLNQKYLNEHDYGGDKAFVKKTTYSPDDDDFCLYPVKNPNYYANTKYASDTSDQATIQNNYISGTVYSDAVGPCIITPFPWLQKVLKYLFESYSFNYIDNFFTQADYKTINIFNTVNLCTNYFVEILGNKFIRFEYDTYNLANHLPEIPTTDFLKTIQTFFNIHFYFMNRKARVVDKLAMIQSLEYDDVTDNVIGEYTKSLSDVSYSGVAFNILRDPNDENLTDLEEAGDYTGIEIAEGDVYDEADPPAYTVMLYQHGTFEGIKYANYYQFISVKDLNPGSADDYWNWTNLSWPLTPQWREHENFCNQNGLYLGNKEFELNAALSTLPEYFFNVSQSNYTFYKPKVKQTGNSDVHRKKTPFSLRLMQYNGVQSDVEGLELPLGSVSNGDVYLSAYWSYVYRWQEYLTWFLEAIKEEYEMKLQLSASEIKNFDFSRKKLIDGNLFFVKSFTVQLLRNDILPAEALLIKAETGSVITS